MTEVIKSKSGLFYRDDDEAGLHVFSPYTGLIYNISVKDKGIVVKWIEREMIEPPSRIYKTTLGAGWYSNLAEATFIKPHILPDSGHWPNEYPIEPLLINWFITGSCPLNCIYCFAEDLMRKKVTNPQLSDIYRIATNILAYNPLVIVLTGGDPLSSPYIGEIIKFLSDKVGIVVDTSAYLLKTKHIELFKKHNVVVRISLDSNNPNINNLQRPLLNEKRERRRLGIEIELAAIKNCLDKNISLVIQTVVTNLNFSTLVDFGDFLIGIGVKVWRLQKLQMPTDLIRKVEIEILTVNNDNINYDDIFEKMMDCQMFRWKGKLSLVISPNFVHTRNSVILVSPEGKFFTESIVLNGKFLIDKDSPDLPNRKSIKKFISHVGHFSRYINV